MTNKTFFVPDYWPSPQYGKIQNFHYVTVDKSMSDLIVKFLISDDKKDLLYVD